MTGLVEAVDALIQKHRFAPAGSRVIVVAGASLGMPSAMNSVVIHTIGETWKAAADSGLPFDGQGMQ